MATNMRKVGFLLSEPESLKGLEGAGRAVDVALGAKRTEFVQ